MSDPPSDARYSADHLWAQPGADSGLVRVGLTDFAQQSLGDVVAVTLPDEGSAITAGVACGEVESTKSDNELVAPISGTVKGRNESLDQDPWMINDDPYGKGWLFDVEVAPDTLTDQLGRLMGASDYERLVVG